MANEIQVSSNPSLGSFPAQVPYILNEASGKYNPLKTTDFHNRGSFINGPTGTTGANVSEEIFSANANRRAFFFQNQSSQNLFIDFGTGVAILGPPSIKILPGGSYSLGSTFIETGKVSVIGSVTGLIFSAKQA